MGGGGARGAYLAHGLLCISVFNSLHVSMCVHPLVRKYDISILQVRNHNSMNEHICAKLYRAASIEREREGERESEREREREHGTHAFWSLFC